MNRLIRFLAVIAIALSPVWGFSGEVEAHNAAYPVWPSFLSTGCQVISGPTGSTTFTCGVSDFLLTQVNSGYACNQLDINVSNFFSGPFTITATVNSGSQSNTVSVNDAGNYYMQFPGFLVNNLITIQIAAPDSGTMTIGYIQNNPCPVATSTPTVNPSFTPTNTPVPVTGTPTAIPTFTPLPSGHSTFTATPLAATGTRTSTPTATGTPNPQIQCGGADFPLLNCPFSGAVPGSGGTAPPNWAHTYGSANCWFDGVIGDDPPFSGNSGTVDVCIQNVVAGATGTVWVQYKASLIPPSTMNWAVFCVDGACSAQIDLSTCPNGGSTTCTIGVGGVTTGVSTTFRVRINASGGGGGYAYINLIHVFVGGTASTPTTVPATSTATGVPGTATATGTPTLTPVPIPGAMSTNIPTATECPGGCAVAKLTAIPGMATLVTVDTSPFSPFTSLSLARSTCAPFGYVAIPYPVVHGTPAYGSTTPLSVTWTIPITAPWDDTHPFSNTAIQPCAMLKEIPSPVWDFTYWFSVFAIAVVFIMWLIGFVGRLSGEETING